MPKINFTNDNKKNMRYMPQNFDYSVVFNFQKSQAKTFVLSQWPPNTFLKNETIPQNLKKNPK